jgi:cyclic pyranopterin phosphate synthase
MTRHPTYLRIVLTEACTMRCTFCHAEGLKLPETLFDGSDGRLESADAHRLMPLNAGVAGMPLGRRISLPLEEWQRMLDVAVRAGVRKIKFLGGEPLVARDLPALIAYVKALAPDADVSIITAGAAPVRKLEACFDAGLDRANLSIHGWTREAFSRNGPPGLFEHRQANLERLLEHGRPLKLNYVYTGPEVEDDLTALLEQASTSRFTARSVLVSVLDDLNHPEMSSETIRQVLARLCGSPLEVLPEADPHSLPTERLRWASGLRVEIKSTRLGDVAPWSVCLSCPRRPVCREGIFALRLDPDGRLRYCADRPDLGFSLKEACNDGVSSALEIWRMRLDALLERSLSV